MTKMVKANIIWLYHRPAHCAHGLDMGIEWPPIVALGNMGPEIFDRFDAHRDRRHSGPIGVVQGSSGLIARKALADICAFFGIGRVCGRGCAARSALPVEEEAVDPDAAGDQGCFDRLDQCTVVLGSLGRDAQPPQHPPDERRAIKIGKAIECFNKGLLIRKPRQGDGQLDNVPMDGLGLPTKGVKSGFIEIGGSEAGIEHLRKAPGAVIETLILSLLSTPWTKPATI